jgi:hypothetical protein
MGENILVIVVGLLILWVFRYLHTNQHLGRIKLDLMTDAGIQYTSKTMLEFLGEEYKQKLPKLNFGDLSKHKAEYDIDLVFGVYVYDQKMIVLDIDALKKHGHNINYLAEIISHEWKHYVDHLLDITYETVGVEMCEQRAHRFAKEGRKLIMKNIELEQ